jgi:hypothetical protein
VRATRTVIGSQVLAPRGPRVRTSSRSTVSDRLAPLPSRTPSLPSRSRPTTVPSRHRPPRRSRQRTRSPGVYAVWDFLTLPEGHQLNPERGIGNLIGFGFKSVTLFTRSTDAGATWSQPRIIYNPGGNNQTIGNQIVVGPDGTLFNFFDEILNFRNDDGPPQFELNVSMKFSPDQGTTWLPKGRPIRIDDLRSRLVRDSDQPTAPRARDRHRTQDIIPDAAVDPTTRTLYATWMDTRSRPDRTTTSP